MQVCTKCGGTHFEERATGKTIRAVLQAALDMSNGERLVLRANVHDPELRTSRCLKFMRRVHEVVAMLGYSSHATRYHIVVAGGGSITFLPYGSEGRGLRFTKEVTTI